MKKTTRALLAPILAFSLLLFSCANDIDSDSTTAGIDSSNDDSVTLTDNDGKSDKDTRKDGTSTSGNNNNSNNSNNNSNTNNTTTNTTVTDFGDNFIRGFDASAVDYFENVYAPAHSDWQIVTKCTDSAGSRDIFNLLASHGFNTIRLRVWVDPSVTETIQNDDYWPTSTDGDNWRIGDCTKERAARLAKRAKTAGMKVLLDMHLSDYWTDPSVQLIPKSWQDSADSDEMAEKLTDYIAETLQYMKEQDATPDYVQVGNEIDRGILVDSSVNAGTTTKTPTDADSAISGKFNTDNFKKYIKAGCKAVRDFDSSIKIIVHMTAKNSSRFSYVESSGADYDIVGLSYYPWENHGTISELKEKIQGFTKDVWVVETSAPANDYGSDGDMTTAATNLGSGYGDITIEDGKLVESESNQKAVLRHVMQEIFDAGGKGICVWGGERRDYQYGLFDWNGNAYEAIDAFNYKPAEGYSTESGASASQNETEETEETMTLTLNFSGFTIPGGSVVVKYGADSGTYVDATGTVSDDGSSATVTLSKKYANSSGWFNNITVTVKDSDENAIETEYTQYFEFSTSGKELTVSKAVSQKTFTINFSGFTIPGGTVEGLRYSTAWANSSDEWEADKIVTPTVTVSSDGTKATFEVAQTDAFYINWTEVTAKDSSGTAVTISSGNTETNKWYGYSGDAWSVTFKVETAGNEASNETLFSGSYSGDGNLTCKVDSANLSSLTISSIVIEATNCDWTNVSGSWWIESYSDEEWTEAAPLDWIDNTHYKAMITDADKINTLKENGIFIAASSGMTCTLTITYTN
ncbi:MAG: arabinogalactan endo-1,4-beta-galactosidase [Treponema sp.]|nr:arabinogalactan endo-1,4-beta-galactosidase [Treponema sp.]